MNALKSLITAEMFCKKKADILDKWMEFRQKGILRTSLIGILIEIGRIRDHVMFCFVIAF